jgi:hypothetical protein
MQLIKNYLILALVTAVLLLLLFVSTNPEILPSFVLFLAFIGVYVVVASSGILIALLFRQMGGFQWQVGKIKKMAWAFALLPTFLLLLRSIGQLTVRDVLLAATLTVIAYLYLRRMSGPPVTEG